MNQDITIVIMANIFKLKLPIIWVRFGIMWLKTKICKYFIIIKYVKNSFKCKENFNKSEEKLQFS